MRTIFFQDLTMTNDHSTACDDHTHDDLSLDSSELSHSSSSEEGDSKNSDEEWVENEEVGIGPT